MQKQKNEELNTSELKKIPVYPSINQRISIKIAMISIFAALALGTSYVLAPLINIELMSFLLFLAGFLYGKYIGIFVGLISSIIYYGWNPFGMPPLPLYLVMIACMVFIGLVGGLTKISNKQDTKIEITISSVFKFALIGFFFTFMFEILANIVFAYFYYGGNIMMAFIIGFPFMVIHLVFNTIIFAFLTIPIYNTVISV